MIIIIFNVETIHSYPPTMQCNSVVPVCLYLCGRLHTLLKVLCTKSPEYLQQ